MAPPRKLNVRMGLAVAGVVVLIGLAVNGDRALVEQALGAFIICDGLFRLYSLATDERDERRESPSRNTAALAGVSTVFLGAGFMSLKSGIAMTLLALAVIVPLAIRSFPKVFGAAVRAGR
jgi:hypothetical protein